MLVRGTDDRNDPRAGAWTELSRGTATDRRKSDTAPANFSATETKLFSRRRDAAASLSYFYKIRIRTHVTEPNGERGLNINTSKLFFRVRSTWYILKIWKYEDGGGGGGVGLRCRQRTVALGPPLACPHLFLDRKTAPRRALPSEPREPSTWSLGAYTIYRSTDRYLQYIHIVRKVNIYYFLQQKLYSRPRWLRTRVRYADKLRGKYVVPVPSLFKFRLFRLRFAKK